ncbi:MAG: SDR family oxidoreductase [Desulfomonile tiedjei]|uniref:SDR family oxidoreductase n=1 Tax=Desulfomonile tiedjei TaxID=2358 RepID=A0A9D6V7T5_9BACT|nr:SDR family oxidoreductase [Desulfomonile tiedjei]
MTAKRNGRMVLVTGGAGFIGSHLVEGLLEKGNMVRVLDDLSNGKEENLHGLGNGRWLMGRDFEFIRGDIRDAETVDKAVKGVDAILHQAALGSVPRSVADPLTTQQVNADGTLQVFWAAKNNGVSRVVFASSSSVYGDSELLPKREGEEGAPLSPYALTKRVNEDFGRLFSNLYGLKTIGLRYFNVYGPRQDPTSAYAAVIPRFLTALLSGDAPVIYGNGEQSRDFTYAKDVVEANLLALEAPASACGAAYNIGRGDQANLLMLLGTLQKLLGTDIKPKFDPPRAGDVMHSSADTSLAARMLGFKAKSDLMSGLGESIQWYKENL